MASKNRLTKAKREALIENMKQELFAERNRRLGEEHHQIAQDFYETIVGRHGAAMKKLPVWMFDQGSEFMVKLKGVGRVDLRMRETQRLWTRARYVEGDHNTFGANEALTERYCKWSASNAELQEEANKVCREARQVLSQVNTVPQLEQLWPQALKWLPAEEEQGSSQELMKLADNLQLMVVDLSAKKPA